MTITFHISNTVRMLFKAGILVLTLCVGSFALPLKNGTQNVNSTVEEDLSIYFIHADPSVRIVGGTPAAQTPHMVALVTGTQVRSLLCGASIITNRHVLTAAHCLDAVRSGHILLSSLRGIVGSIHFASGGLQLTFSRSVIHGDYWPEPVLKNDLAILTTSLTIPLSNAVRIININYDWVGAGVATYVTGWGRTFNGGPVSQVLLRLDALSIDGNRCRQDVARRAAELNMRGIPTVDPNLEVCTFHSHGRGMCHGDSGSALVRSDRNEQIGITSWALPCANGAPDVFVRLSTYRNWIERNAR
ncbi:unnamed protein product, partial [Brenthis ino]